MVEKIKNTFIMKTTPKNDSPWKQFLKTVSYFSRKKKLGPVGTYTFQVVSIPEELDYPESLPLEIRYLLHKHPSIKREIKNLLRVPFGGKALGVKTVETTPQRLLDAINDISIHSQHSTILTWLPELLRQGHIPKYTPQDVLQSKKQERNLQQAAQYILEYRHEFKKIVLVDEGNEGVTASERQFLQNLNEEIYDISINWIIHRLIADNAHERTKVAQTIIKSLLVVGPIAHFLEIYTQGWGKVFAASADDLLSETAELFALRGAGFSWRTLAKRARILLPVFILATYLALRVEHYIKLEAYITAGALFGLSAVMLSLTTAIQSIFLYMNSIKKLIHEKKLSHRTQWQQFTLAFRQDFTNPARLGLGLGAIASPIVSMFFFSLLPEFTHNGWILAFLGSTESFVAALTVIASKYINQKNFERKIKHSFQ